MHPMSVLPRPALHVALTASVSLVGLAALYTAASAQNPRLHAHPRTVQDTSATHRLDTLADKRFVCYNPTTGEVYAAGARLPSKCRDFERPIFLGPLLGNGGGAGQAAAGQTDLDAAVQSVTISRIPQEAASAGDPVVAEVELPLGTALAQLAEVPIDLDLILKGLLFGDTVVAHRESGGGAPVFDFTKGVVGLTGGVTSIGFTRITDSVPGYVGKLAGKVRLSLPRLKVEWTVFDADGNQLTPATDFVPIGGSTALPQLNVVIRPPLAELTSSLVPEAQYRLVASTQVCVGGSEGEPETCSLSRNLETTVPVAKLAIPTVLALYRDTHHGGPFMVIVPGNSPLSSRSAVVSRLAKLLEAFQKLQGVADWFPVVPEVGDALEVLDRAAVHFKAGDEIKHLENYEMEDEGFWDNGEDGDNYFSSLVYFSAGRPVRCYNSKDFEDDEPWFTLSSTVLAIVPSLHSEDPSVSPSGGPLPASLHPHMDGPDRPFGDRLSSVKFP
jgi:hypothetical protein